MVLFEQWFSSSMRHGFKITKNSSAVDRNRRSNTGLTTVIFLFFMPAFPLTFDQTCVACLFPFAFSSTALLLGRLSFVIQLWLRLRSTVLALRWETASTMLGQVGEKKSNLTLQYHDKLGTLSSNMNGINYNNRELNSSRFKHATSTSSYTLHSDR